MKTWKFRNKVCKALRKASYIDWDSITFEGGNDQSILVQLSDGSKFQILIVRTERDI